PVIAGVRRRRQALLTEVLKGPDPVQIGGKGRIAERRTARDRRRSHVEKPGDVARRRRREVVRRRVQRNGAREADGGARHRQRARARGCRHLKSLREKITIAASSSAAMYAAP